MNYKSGLFVFLPYIEAIIFLTMSNLKKAMYNGEVMLLRRGDAAIVGTCDETNKKYVLEEFYSQDYDYGSNASSSWKDKYKDEYYDIKFIFSSENL